MKQIDWTTAEERTSEVVSRIWKHFVGVPAVGAFAAEWEWLKDQIEALDRAAFTMGMRETAKQLNRAALSPNTTPPSLPDLGAIVSVDAPAYKGEGIVREARKPSPAYVGVELEHGGVRYYEAQTVTVIPEATASWLKRKLANTTPEGSTHGAQEK